MTLFDVAKKNIKGNFNSYSIYFISMLACVMVYYIFVSLGYNQDIAKSIESSQSMASLFMLGSAFFDLHLKGMAQDIFELEKSPFEEAVIVR